MPTVFQIVFLVIYLVVIIISYFLIVKRLNSLTNRNELKIGERVKRLEDMTHRLKNVMKLVFFFLFVSGAFIIITLL